MKLDSFQLEFAWTNHAPGNEEEAKLVKHYSYLINQIVKRLEEDEDAEDARSEGYMAMLNAIRKFQPEKGFQPQTYIARSIQHAVGKYWAKREKILKHQSPDGEVPDADERISDYSLVFDTNCPKADDIVDSIVGKEIYDSLDGEEGAIFLDFMDSKWVWETDLKNAITSLKAKYGYQD